MIFYKKNTSGKGRNIQRNYCHRIDTTNFKMIIFQKMATI
ncbi:hypothetical protein ABVS_0378 [Acinetobacter lwoffii]|nr:hypothetical protein ABVS_0378 [Acinetobacter lwoffii]